MASRVDMAVGANVYWTSSDLLFSGYVHKILEIPRSNQGAGGEML